jgi:acyl-CoA thioesterase-1
MKILEKYRLKIIFILFLLTSYSITAQSKKLLILGDSISAGYGIKESENWVSLLQSEFDKEILEIFNSSISGETTIGGLSRISTALDKFNPDIVLIELGGNDALRGYPPIRIKNNLKNIILKVKENGALPLLMQIRIPPNYGQKYVLAFEEVFKEISQEEEISLIPFMLNNVALDKSLMQRDGIHPNIKAQPIIAKFLKENLLKFIE